MILFIVQLLVTGLWFVISLYWASQYGFESAVFLNFACVIVSMWLGFARLKERDDD